MKRDQVFEFFRRLAEAQSRRRRPSSNSGNPYQLLVAVVLSAQATDASVNIATRAAVQARRRRPQQMVELGEDALRDAIKTIGLFNTKAKNVIALSQALIDDYGGEVPRTREELQSAARASAARPPTSSSTPRSARRRSRSTRTSSASATAPASRRARRRRGRGQARKDRPAALPPRRAPLADPARPLHLQGAAARMLALPGDRPLPLQAEDAAARGAAKSTAARTGRPSSSAARTAKGRTASTPTASRSRSRPSRLP